MKKLTCVTNVTMLILLIRGFIFPGSLSAQPLPGGSLDPLSIPKYQLPLIIPPVMPKTDEIEMQEGKNIDYYEIAVRQFRQHILPEDYPSTVVWSYGSVNHPGTFNYPAFTIEAEADKPVRVKWINDLKDPVTGNFLPHLFAVDQTLHWANPSAGNGNTDSRGTDPNPYVGPVPIVTHVHGAHTFEESDGYPEAWYLPNAVDIPQGYATGGLFYDTFKTEFESNWGQEWEPGAAVFQYPNNQLATTLWYHDHTLGMTRLNVYAGPAGFYLIRGGTGDINSGLPEPAPGPANDPNIDPASSDFYEIPIVIQDRSFNKDGTFFYPDNRAFFEGLEQSQLQIPFIPEEVCEGQSSDISAIWNPEFFGNTMVVNGRTWPYLQVEKRRYRFRLLNGCNSRFLILKMNNEMPIYQIGSDGGFLPEPIMLERLLLGPSERADVIVDFTDIPEGTEIIMLNIGPDEPFGGGEPDTDFDLSDPNTTGQVMQFRVVEAKSIDTSIPPMELSLPAKVSLGDATVTRQLTLNEEESSTVFVEEEDGNIEIDCEDGEAFAPKAALLGTLADGALLWSDTITETPTAGETEIWEIINLTEDAHPIHLHQVQFEIIERKGLTYTFEPEPGEKGWKDTVIAYPGETTRIKARFDIPGLFVWHCHILEHEDNEMMRPYRVLP